MAPPEHAPASLRASELTTPAVGRTARIPTFGGARALRWVRDPLCVFALIALSLFAIERVIRPARGDEAITVDEVKRRELTALFQQRQGRTPTKTEASALVQSYLDDEVLLREALKLELPRRDPALRDQLVARMRALLATSSRSSREPDNPELSLRRYFEGHRATYALPERVSLLEYVIPNSPSAEDDARETLRSLQHERPPDHQERPVVNGERTERELEQLYGRAFVNTVRALPIGVWQLVRSPSAVHLVHIERRTPASEPAYEQVAPRVREDYRMAEDQRRFDEQLARLRKTWNVAREPSP